MVSARQAKVRTGVAIIAVEADTAWLSDGTRIAAAAVLATTGQRPVSVPGLESLPHDDAGRLVANAKLAVAPHVWAAGDTARIAHPKTGSPVAANALWAIKAGSHLGRNLALVAKSKRPKRFRYRGLGQAMAFGVGRAATEMYGGANQWVGRMDVAAGILPAVHAAAAARDDGRTVAGGRILARDP